MSPLSFPGERKVWPNLPPPPSSSFPIGLPPQHAALFLNPLSCSPFPSSGEAGTNDRSKATQQPLFPPNPSTLLLPPSRNFFQGRRSRKRGAKGETGFANRGICESRNPTFCRSRRISHLIMRHILGAGLTATPFGCTTAPCLNQTCLSPLPASSPSPQPPRAKKGGGKGNSFRFSPSDIPPLLCPTSVEVREGGRRGCKGRRRKQAVFSPPSSSTSTPRPPSFFAGGAKIEFPASRGIRTLSFSPPFLPLLPWDGPLP